MAQGFNAEPKCQREWGWLLSIWLFLSGSASGLFVLFQIFDLPLPFALTALGAILIGAAVLLVEQGSPLRAWRAVSRPSTSWLSRGLLSVSLFVLTALLSIATATLPWLTWAGGSLVGQVSGWVAGLCAVMIVLYPGFFLAKNRSVPFWNTCLLPVVFVSYAATGASGMILLGSALLKNGLSPFDAMAAVFLVLDGVLLALYVLVMDRAGGSARKSVRLLNRASLGWIFHIGVVLVGLIVPLGMIVWMPTAAVAAGACMLIGSFLFRYCILKAGVYLPPALAQEDVDFSMFKGNRIQIELEYEGMSARNDAGSR